jgi:hypothetical protein
MASSGQERRFKAVFFDIGGVVVGSPFSGIAAYEKQHSLPVNYLNVAMQVYPSASVLVASCTCLHA